MRGNVKNKLLWNFLFALAATTAVLGLSQAVAKQISVLLLSTCSIWAIASGLAALAVLFTPSNRSQVGYSKANLSSSSSEPQKSSRSPALARALVFIGGLAFIAAARLLLDVSTVTIVLIATGSYIIWHQLQEAVSDNHSPWQRISGLSKGASNRNEIGLIVGLLMVAVGLLWMLLAGNGGGFWGRTQLVLVAALAFAAIAGPLLWSINRESQRQLADKVRLDERAGISAHLHDSVLQTLALIQRASDDPANVRTLARQQESDLRNWLSGRDAQLGSFESELKKLVATLEITYGGVVELVFSGDSNLAKGSKLAALLQATQEAVTNSFKHSANENKNAVTINIFVQSTPTKIELFIRDRGKGFDLSEVSNDRRGLSESIVGRMQRAGGKALITSEIGSGTEIELSMPLDRVEGA